MPLCETCWKDLTLRDRLPYYRRMFEEWLERRDLSKVSDIVQELDTEEDKRKRRSRNDATWQGIEDAVLGKGL